MASIVVPVYNTAPYLVQCLSSITNQTYSNLELIVIDDGSDDGCAEICDEFARDDKRVIVIHTANAGLSAARNRGIKLAIGDFILFVDADDWVEPRAVETLVHASLQTGADVVCCRRCVEWMMCTSLPKSSPESHLLHKEDALEELLFGNLLDSVAWAKLYRVSLFEAVRYPEGMVFEDVATTYKLIMLANTVACIPDVLCHYRMREGSIAHKYSPNCLLDRWHAYEGRYLEIREKFPDLGSAALEGCILAIGSVWSWAWAVRMSRGNRRQFTCELTKMEHFSRKHFCEVLYGKAAVKTKVLCLLGCWASPVVWWPMYAVNQLRHRYVYRHKMYP